MKRALLDFIGSLGILAAASAPAQEIFLQSAWQNTIPAPSVAIWSGGNESRSGPGVSGGDFPIAVTGYNRDVVVENTATGGNATAYAQTFTLDTGSGGLAFYEAGLGDIASWQPGNGSQGLPQRGLFTSILDGITTFQLGPYTGSNVLYMTPSSPSANLTLVTPAAYNSLSILAASAGGGGAGTFVILFDNGTSSPPISFNASDWGSSSPGSALTHFGMISCFNSSVFFTFDDPGNLPNLYQTTVNLAALGFNAKTIISLTFTMPSGPGTSTNTATGVFALSGTPTVPVPANAIYLAESAIGQITAQWAAYPNAATDLANAGNSIRTAGNAYRYTPVGTTLESIPAVAWNVVFPGGFNPATGSNYATGVQSTYIASDIAQADYDLRARLQVNPEDADAAQQLVLLVEDQMLPAGLYQLDQTGTIYQQWQAVQTAETNLLLASIQLSNTFATMLTKKQVADAIYSNQVTIATLILTNGQQVAAIDQQEGQVQAQADQAIAQIQATTAQQQANNSFWGSIAEVGAGIAAEAFTGGLATPLLAAGVAAGAGGGVASAFESKANGYDQASADLQIGSVQANEATQLADLNAQITQINASEQAVTDLIRIVLLA